MRSAKVHFINEDLHWYEYAEPAYLEDWTDKAERHLKMDAEAKWQIGICLLCAALLLVCWLTPWVERMFR